MVLDGQGIPRRQGMTRASLAISTTLISMDISAEEVKPRYMKGYGDVSEITAAELNGIAGELQALFVQFHLFMKQEAGQDPRARMKRLEESGSDLSLLSTIERVVADRGLVEFRGAINAILDRAEDKSFEIAVFGRVSSGKSSLLNAILGTNVLPVGVTPVTAVPVRITGGEKQSITISFAGSPARSFGIEKLSEYATEQENPGNLKKVSRITVHSLHHDCQKGSPSLIPRDSDLLPQVVPPRPLHTCRSAISGWYLSTRDRRSRTATCRPSSHFRRQLSRLMFS